MSDRGGSTNNTVATKYIQCFMYYESIFMPYMQSVDAHGSILCIILVGVVKVVDIVDPARPPSRSVETRALEYDVTQISLFDTATLAIRTYFNPAVDFDVLRMFIIGMTLESKGRRRQAEL